MPLWLYNADSQCEYCAGQVKTKLEVSRQKSSKTTLLVQSFQGQSYCMQHFIQTITKFMDFQWQQITITRFIIIKSRVILLKHKFGFFPGLRGEKEDLN